MGKIRLAVVLVAVIATTAIAAPTAQAQTTTTTNPTYQRASVSFWKAWDCLLGAAAFIAGTKDIGYVVGTGAVVRACTP